MSENNNSVVSITFGCPDPAKLAEFYRQATGAETIFESDTAVYLAQSNGVRLGFDRVPDFEPPEWSSERLPVARVDISAEDLGRSERRLLELGAVRPGHRFDAEQWIFMADPAGHPFTLTTVY